MIDTFDTYSELNPANQKEVKREVMEIDYKLITNIEFDGVDPTDAPDYADAYIVSADYEGCEGSDALIDELNDNHSEFVYERLIDSLN